MSAVVPTEPWLDAAGNNWISAAPVYRPLGAVQTGAEFLDLKLFSEAGASTILIRLEIGNVLSLVAGHRGVSQQDVISELKEVLTSASRSALTAGRLRSNYTTKLGDQDDVLRIYLDGKHRFRVSG